MIIQKVCAHKGGSSQAKCVRLCRKGEGAGLILAIFVRKYFVDDPNILDFMKDLIEC